MPTTLPISKHIPEIKNALKTRRCAVIQAPPGAGKTTRIPLELLDEPWLANKKILLLEPRRLAAISCAAHMADLLNQRVGQTIGYRIRMDRKVGPDTRIEVMTEGIFTRMIQNDPSLQDIGLVIFDEFHERHIQSDLGLALCLETVEALRPDLGILVMSATMELSGISTLLGNAPAIVSKGRTYEVETVYLPPPQQSRGHGSIESACAGAVAKALLETRGDILIFLPGAGEIRRLAKKLEETHDPDVQLYPLYGALSRIEQAGVFLPSPGGKRKIVLATSIAETSITIEGIEVVIDAGLMRVPKFSPGTGMSRLETIRVSKASADQRRGRAGRTAPGICYRLWSAYDHKLLKSFTPPEILRVDMTGTVLELAAWGVSDPGILKWLDPPEPSGFEQGQRLLKALGALDSQNRITAHGKKMVSAGVNPRLSHMILKAKQMGKGVGALACRIAALFSERDFIRSGGRGSDPDIRLRLELIENRMQKRNFSGHKKGINQGINQGILHRIMASEKKIKKDFNIKGDAQGFEAAGRLLAHAYPDRIAQKRDNKNNRFLMASGKGAFFFDTNPVSIHDFIVAVHLDGNPVNAGIFLAAPYSEQDLMLDFGSRMKIVTSVFWDREAGAVRACEKTCFEQLVITQRKLTRIDPGVTSDLLLAEIKHQGPGILPWTKKLTSLKERACFLKRAGKFNDLSTLPDVSDRALKENAGEWLEPFLTGISSLKQLKRMDLTRAFLSIFTFRHQQTIEKMAPSHLVVPSGSRKPLKYSREGRILDAPVLEVRLQEMFGLSSTPKIAGGRIPVTFHLLSPAGRPVQITNDLESFWNHTYREVKKDLMGRYPKHFWPDNPLEAMPTNRVKPRRKKT